MRDITIPKGRIVYVKEVEARMEEVQREFDAENPDLDPNDGDAVFAAMMAFANKKIAETK